MPTTSREPGLACPSCGGRASRVYSSSYLPRELRGLPVRLRIRQCSNCDANYNTVELTEELFNQLRWPAALRRNQLRSPE